MPAKLIEIQYLEKDEYSLWDEFVKNSPQGSFFCSIVWLSILEEIYNRPLKILICKSNQKIVAGIPFFENKKLFWKLITPVFLLSCDGPLFYSNSETKPQKIIADQIKFLDKMLKRLKDEYKLIQLKTHYSHNDLRVFTWNDFQIEPEHTYICQLENEEIITSRFNQSLRKKIQKSIELDYRITCSKNFNVFVEMYISSYQRHNRLPPISSEKLKLLLQKIIDLPNIRLFFVNHKNQVLAGRIIVEDEDTIFDLLAGSNDENGLASSFLVAEIMKRYAGKFKYFDFMGADHPQIERFKRAFGGELKHRFKVQNMLGIFLSSLLKIRKKAEMSRREI